MVKENKINKADFTLLISNELGVTRREARAFIEAYHKNIKEQLAKGNSVDFIGFGKYELRERSARKGRNPQTGELIQIPATIIPAFKAGKALRDAVK